MARKKRRPVRDLLNSANSDGVENDTSMGDQNATEMSTVAVQCAVVTNEDVHDSDAPEIVLQFDEDNEEWRAVEELVAIAKRRVFVTFYEWNNKEDEGIALPITINMSYAKIVSRLAKKIGTEPNLISLVKPSGYKDGSGGSVDLNDDELINFLLFEWNDSVKKLFYFNLEMPIEVVESFTFIKCRYYDKAINRSFTICQFPPGDWTTQDFLDFMKPILNEKVNREIGPLHLFNVVDEEEAFEFPKDFFVGDIVFMLNNSVWIVEEDVMNSESEKEDVTEAKADEKEDETEMESDEDSDSSSIHSTKIEYVYECD